MPDENVDIVSVNATEHVVEYATRNLRRLGKSYQFKHYGNILANIQLAASYLCIMNLVIVSLFLSHILL